METKKRSTLHLRIMSHVQMFRGYFVLVRNAILAIIVKHISFLAPFFFWPNGYIPLVNRVTR